jgi:hypothetical protein
MVTYDLPPVDGPNVVMGAAQWRDEGMALVEAIK